MYRYIVTEENIEAVRDMICSDQAERLEVGCETWSIIYTGGQSGCMTIWPNGRGGIMLGGDTDWGDWDDKTETLTLDETDENGSPIVFDATGDRVSE